MLSLPIHTTLAEVQNDAISYDNRLLQRAQEQRNTSRQPYVPRSGYQSQPTTSSYSNGLAPMEVDSIQTKFKGKITDAERKHCKEMNLCLFYGKSDCPGSKDVTLCPNVMKKSGNDRRSATNYIAHFTTTENIFFALNQPFLVTLPKEFTTKQILDLTNDPKTYEECIQRPDAEFWQNAQASEFHSLKARG
ncbi:hypothetical protein HK096_010390, partial [Nowakowskiella sp. JEL0078]